MRMDSLSVPVLAACLQRPAENEPKRVTVHNSRNLASAPRSTLGNLLKQRSNWNPKIHSMGVYHWPRETDAPAAANSVCAIASPIADKYHKLTGLKDAILAGQTEDHAAPAKGKAHKPRAGAIEHRPCQALIEAFKKLCNKILPARIIEIHCDPLFGFSEDTVFLLANCETQLEAISILKKDGLSGPDKEYLRKVSRTIHESLKKHSLTVQASRKEHLDLGMSEADLASYVATRNEADLAKYVATMKQVHERQAGPAAGSSAPIEKFQTAFERVRGDALRHCMTDYLARIENLHHNDGNSGFPTAAFVAFNSFCPVYWNAFEDRIKSAEMESVSEDKALHDAHDQATDSAIAAAVTAYREATGADSRQKPVPELKAVLTEMGAHLDDALRTEMTRLTTPVVMPPRQVARPLPFQRDE
jgi:hypothetical protein